MKDAFDNRRILIVDDTEGIHQDFKAILGDSNDAGSAALDQAEAAILGTNSDSSGQVGFEMDSAYQGQEALDKVKQALNDGKPYAMAFVDVRMPPGWDGIETIKRIWEVYPELQVVICTAYSDYQWSEIIDKLGQTERLLILKKPFDNVEVYQLANALTEKWNLARKASMRMEELEQVIGEKTNELTEANKQLTSEINERKEAQEKLEKYRNDLEVLVEERTEELAKEKELLSVTLSSLTSGVVAVDAQRKVILFNEVAQELTGWTFEEVKDKTIDEVFRVINEHMRDVIEGLIDKVLKSERAEVAEDCEALIVSNGRDCQIATVAAPIRKNDGDTVGVVIVFRDVSKEREIERMKSDFVSSISHELRTPLTSIKAYTATILRDPEMGEETQKEFLKIIDEESNRLATLIEDLLEISRIESGTYEIEREPVDIAAIIKQVSLTLKPLAEKKDISLKVDASDELPKIQGDPSRIESVVVNLVNNAIKFTPEQGQVTVSASYQGEQLVMRISDTGIGIPNTDLMKIFNRFYRVSRPGKEIQGTGLGLAIVKKIVSLHGGEIKVDSQVGKGTTFTVSLPLDAQVVASSSALG